MSKPEWINVWSTDKPFDQDRCDAPHDLSSDHLQTCSRCKVARYCNADCQKEDWSYHKKCCAALKRDAENTAKIVATGGHKQFQDTAERPMPQDKANQWIVTNGFSLELIAMHALGVKCAVSKASTASVAPQYPDYVAYIYATTCPDDPARQIIYRVDLRRVDAHKAVFDKHCADTYTVGAADRTLENLGFMRWYLAIISLDDRDQQYLLFPHINPEDNFPLQLSLSKFIRYVNRGVQTFSNALSVTPGARENRNRSTWGKVRDDIVPLESRALDRRGYVVGKHREKRNELCFQALPKRVWKV